MPGHAFASSPASSRRKLQAHTVPGYPDNGGRAPPAPRALPPRCGLASIGASTGTTAKAPVVSAGAYAVQVNIPGQPGASAGGTTAPSEVTTATADTFTYPADGSAIKTGGLSSSAYAEGTTAQGVSDVLGISLFNGEITAESVAAQGEGIDDRVPTPSDPP